MAIDTINRHLVTIRGDEILVLLPPAAPMTKQQALELAAWLVALADGPPDLEESQDGTRFDQILAAVQAT